MTNTEYAIAMLTAIRDCNKFVMTGENHNCGDGTCEACKLYPYVYADKSKKIEALETAIKHIEAWEKVIEEVEETDFKELLSLAGDVDIIKIGVLNTIKNALKEVENG